MDKGDFALKDSCLVLEELIERDKKKLNDLHEEVQSRDPNVSVTRSHIERSTVFAAIEALKHNLATFQGEIKALQKSSTYHREYFYAICIMLHFYLF